MTYTHILDLAAKVEPTTESLFRSTVYQDDQIVAMLFGFRAGDELPEHKAAKTALLYFVKGEVELKLGEDTQNAQPGTWVHMPMGLKHAVRAKTAAVMLLVLLK